MPFRRTTTFFAPALTTDSRASWSSSAGSPMVGLPWTSSPDTPPGSGTLISMGNLSVIVVRQTILIESRGPFATPQGIIRWRMSRIKGTVPEDYMRLLQNRGERRIRKTNSENSNLKQRGGARMRIMLGDEMASPRKSNPEPAERTYL